MMLMRYVLGEMEISCRKKRSCKDYEIFGDIFYEIFEKILYKIVFDFYFFWFCGGVDLIFCLL